MMRLVINADDFGEIFHNSKWKFFPSDFQQDDKLDMAGILMDMHESMSNVVSILARHRPLFELVPYSEAC